MTGAWFSPGTPVFSTNKTNHHDITIVESGVKHYNPNQELPFYPMYIKPIQKKVSLKTIPPLMKYMINYLHSQVLGIVGHF